MIVQLHRKPDPPLYHQSILVSIFGDKISCIYDFGEHGSRVFHGAYWVDVIETYEQVLELLKGGSKTRKQLETDKVSISSSDDLTNEAIGILDGEKTPLRFEHLETMVIYVYRQWRDSVEESMGVEGFPMPLEPEDLGLFECSKCRELSASCKVKNGHCHFCKNDRG